MFVRKFKNWEVAGYTWSVPYFSLTVTGRVGNKESPLYANGSITVRVREKKAEGGNDTGAHRHMNFRLAVKCHLLLQ